MGVTTLARVNGPGAYSARSAAQGKSKSQRIAAARKLLNNGGKMQKRGRRASFVSNANPGAKKRGKRLAAYNAARKRGMNKNAAARSALRKVPWTATERRSGSSFQSMRANPKRKAAKKNPTTGRKTRTTKRRRMRANPTAAQYEQEVRTSRASGTTPAAPSKPKSRKRKGTAKRKTKRATAKRKTKKRVASQYKTVPATKRVRYKFGKYKRARIVNPRTGKVQYSYMYRTKGGRLRRIPTSAVVGKKVKGTKELPAKVRTARARTAKRIIRSGGAFTPNASSRARKRAAEKARLMRAGYSATKAARAALRKYPWTVAEKQAGKTISKRGKIVTRKAKSARGGKKRKATSKRKGARKGVSRKRSLAAKRGWAKRRRAGTAPTKRRSIRKGARKGTKSATSRKRSLAAKRGWAKRKQKYGKSGRSLYRKNADRFVTFMTTTALVGVGVVLHRGITAGILLLLTGTTSGETAAAADTTAASGLGRYRRRRGVRGLGQTETPSMTKPAVSAGVAMVGSLAAVYAGGEAGTVIAAGMIGSSIGQLMVYGLKIMGQNELASALGGYSNSMAFSLRGRGVGRYRRRPALRGTGAASSILPRYAPVGAFRQAAAGTHMPNRLGEYFTPNPLGEYFAPSNLEGVGAYEPAGQMAMQASAGTGQIDDGIRPDTNLDRVLDLAEAAAGLRGVGAAKFAQAMAGRPGGVGEYITAERTNGDFTEQRVPTSSQWIPNGPLWAGTLGVTGDTQTSDIPAGILAGPGGNGVLSGG